MTACASVWSGDITLALRNDGYLLKARASMSSLTSLPRSPQNIRKSSATTTVTKTSRRLRLQRSQRKETWDRLKRNYWSSSKSTMKVSVLVWSVVVCTWFPVQQAGVLPARPCCRPDALLHLVRLCSLLVVCSSFHRLKQTHVHIMSSVVDPLYKDLLNYKILFSLPYLLFCMSILNLKLNLQKLYFEHNLCSIEFTKW